MPQQHKTAASHTSHSAINFTGKTCQRFFLIFSFLFSSFFWKIHFAKLVCEASKLMSAAAFTPQLYLKKALYVKENTLNTKSICHFLLSSLFWWLICVRARLRWKESQCVFAQKVCSRCGKGDDEGCLIFELTSLTSDFMFPCTAFDFSHECLCRRGVTTPLALTPSPWALFKVKFF